LLITRLGHPPLRLQGSALCCFRAVKPRPSISIYPRDARLLLPKLVKEVILASKPPQAGEFGLLHRTG
jgi:hypothetical protein